MGDPYAHTAQLPLYDRQPPCPNWFQKEISSRPNPDYTDYTKDPVLRLNEKIWGR